MSDLAQFSEHELREHLLHARADAEAAQARNIILQQHLRECAESLQVVMEKMGDWCAENGPPKFLRPEEVMTAMGAWEGASDVLRRLEKRGAQKQ